MTKSISGSEPRMSSGNIPDEKRALESEVSRLEDLLSSTRAERDEISSKYLAVSERVSMKFCSNMDNLPHEANLFLVCLE